MTENVTLYDPSVLQLGHHFGGMADLVGSRLSVSNSVILGAILEEYNDRINTPFELFPNGQTQINQLSQSAADLLAVNYVNINSHSEIKLHFENIQSLSPEQRADLSKISNSLMIDVGPGNIQSYTAIVLLEEYLLENQQNDPLALVGYANDYGRLINDLNSYDSHATAAFAGLMVKKGLTWGAGHIANWDSLSVIEQEGFAVYFYNVGEDFMESRYANRVAETGEYIVDIGKTKIAQEYILNRQPIINFNADGIVGLDAFRCFPAGTPITLADGAKIAIETITPDTMVLAVNDAGSLGRGTLEPCRVVRTFTNITDEWVKISYTNSAGHAVSFEVTPGHDFINELGQWEKIEAIAARDGQLVLEDGELAHFTSERILYSEQTAHLYEQAEIVRHNTQGGLALAPTIERGWKTYNCEVERLHSYVAAGVRAHNDSGIWGEFGNEIDNALNNFGVIGDVAGDAISAAFQ